MAPRAIRSPLALVVLGLLAEQPLHPYAMRSLMRERGHERIINRGAASLYDAVARLDRDGLIEVQSSTRAGRRPERTTYRITVAGVGALRSWVREGLRDPERPEAFRAALSFMFAVGEREVIDLLDERADRLRALIETSDGELARAGEAGVAEIFLSEGRYERQMWQAEHDWLSLFAQQLRSGEARWSASPAFPASPVGEATPGHRGGGSAAAS